MSINFLPVAAFLDGAPVNNPLKCEAGTAAVRVLPCEETWYDVMIAGMKKQGICEENLWN